MDINQISSIAMPIILGGIVYLVKKLIVPIGDTVIDYLVEKKTTLGITKQLANHQEEILTAKQVWGIVEEKYRITQKVEDLLVSKSQMFDQLLLKKIPYLTQENLDDLRQAIAGEFNKGKQAVISDDTLKQSQVELTNTNTSLIDTNSTLQATNKQLQAEKEILQSKLDSITNALSPIITTATDNEVPASNDTIVDNSNLSTVVGTIVQ
jgi:hypothetical protein